MNTTKTRNESTTRTAAPKAGRMRRMRARAGSLSCKALSIAMSAILVAGLSPLTKAAAASERQASAQASRGQLPSGTYWYNGDMSFTAIDASNGFTSGAWDAYRDTGKDGSGNALGIAGSFHLVAFDTLNSSSHIYGNILANHVRSIADYGVKPEFADIYGHGTLSYIQDYQAANNRFGEQSYANQAIVFGSNTDAFSLTSCQNNGHDTIKFVNGVNAPWGSEVTFPRTIAQDLDTQSAPFIDMNAVKAETTSLSASLSRHATDGATYDFSDQNKKTISYTKGAGCAYLTLPLSALTQNGNPLYIKGLPLDGSAALVINVDCGGADAPIPDQVWLEAAGGQNAGLGENDADTGYVLWNFTNAKTVTAMGMVSSILAPGATINLKGNSCGTFIGDDINVSGETHTRPFHGKFEEKEQPKPETTSVSVSKRWLDSKGGAEAADVVAAHGGVQAQLLANGTASGDAVELNAGNGWSFAWTDLPVKDEAGNAVAYTVQEASSPSGYDSSVTGEGNAFTIVNKHKPETSISAQKVWDDNDDIDRIRPDSVVARVMRTYEGAAGFEEVGTLTLSAENGWSASRDGLPTENVDGEKYSYSLQEDSVTGYTGEVKSSSSVDGDGNVSYSFTLVNKHAASKIAVSVSKAWDDDGDQDGIRPASIKVSLLRTEGSDGAATVVRELELTAAGGWQASVSDLPVWGPNGKYAYSVSEAAVAGYSSTVKATADASGNCSFALTNKHAVETTSVGVAKAWDDGDDADGIRPSSVEVELVADGVATGGKATLSADAGWSFTWDNLAKKAGGKEIAYSVREVNVPEGYSASTFGGKSVDGKAFSFTLKNTHEQATASVKVKKAWDDASDADGLRPSSVKVQLLADGQAVGDPVVLDANGGWKHEWADLAKRADGKEIAYTIAELDVPAGYTSSVVGNATVGFTITNSHKVATTGIGVKKVWDDGGDQDGIRPASVTAQLLANGEVAGTVELSAANNWAYAWSDLPVYANGEKVAYSVREAGAHEGYASSVTGDAANGFTITNTHAVAETSVSVHKEWKDAEGNDQPGVHPAVTAQLYRAVAGGEPEVMAGYTVTLDAEHGWAATWANLPARSGGKDVTYSVREADVPAGYQSAVAPDGEGGFAFTLTNTAEKRVGVSVTKAWDDGDDADGIRPASVTAQLCTVDAQGNPVAVAGKAVELSAANGWTYTWGDLASVDAEGNAISYTVQEANVPEGYRGSISGGKVEGGDFSFTMTNAHELKTVGIDVSKAWNDDGDVDGLRPANVVVELCSVNAAGETVAVEGAEQKVLDEDNGWSAGWTGLVANKAGKAVKYTVREVEVPEGYTSSVSGLDNGDGTYSFTLTNTHEVEVAEFSLGGYSVQSITAPVPEADKVCYVDPKVNKVLVGRTLEEGEFNFQLIDKATGAVVSETGNDRFGMVDFDRANNLADEGMEPCCLKFTSPGTYTYEVREAPGVKDPTVEYSAERIEFVVTVENVEGKLKATDMRYNRYEDASATVAEQLPTDAHPTITNKVKAIELGLSKTDAETGEAVPGATYGLYRADASSVDGSVLVAKATSGADGHMTFTTTGGSENIETGVEYWFEEISAPQGYERSLDQTQRFHIERVGTGPDSAYKLVYADGSESQRYSVGTVVEYGDGATGVADRKLSAAIAKVNSARAGLAGAKLGVRPADGTDPVDEWESNGAGHVLSGLTADTRYVLYEVEAPDGFEKAADVTFTVDDLGAITLVDGAWNGSALNSYASDGTLSLVDYTHTEIVDKKVQQREQAKTTAKKGSLTQTGDHAPVLPLVAGAVVALGVLIAAGVALRRSRKR